MEGDFCSRESYSRCVLAAKEFRDYNSVAMSRCTLASSLLAINQDSNTVVVFRIDPTTGRLTPTGQSVEVSLPSCVTFVTGQ
jgi:hypothetical protein